MPVSEGVKRQQKREGTREGGRQRLKGEGGRQKEGAKEGGTERERKKNHMNEETHLPVTNLTSVCKCNFIGTAIRHQIPVLIDGATSMLRPNIHQVQTQIHIIDAR